GEREDVRQVRRVVDQRISPSRRSHSGAAAFSLERQLSSCQRGGRCEESVAVVTISSRDCERKTTKPFLSITKRSSLLVDAFRQGDANGYARLHSTFRHHSTILIVQNTSNSRNDFSVQRFRRFLRHEWHARA